jgi:hypothetical protein
MFKLILVASTLCFVISVNNFFTGDVKKFKPTKKELIKRKEKVVLRQDIKLTSHRLKYEDSATGYTCYLMFSDNGMYCVFLE